MRRPAVIAAVFCPLVLLAAPAPALAREPECVLTGIVTDETGAPLAATTVTLEPGNATTRTDAEGRYCFAAAAPDAYTVLAERDGFAEIGVVDIGAQGGPWELDLVLLVAMREDVVVTATRTRKGLAEVPVRTEVVSRQSMAATAARTLADAVEYTTGVRVESNCQNCNFSQIRMLGLEGPYTQILMDGQPLISSLAQVYGIEQIPTRMIDRIEVVKGGGSALYGPGAVGGVVNVIPRQAAQSGGGFAFDYGSMGGEPNLLGNGSYDWVSGSRRTRLTAFAQIDRISPYDVDGDGFTEVAQRDLDALGFRLGRQVLGNAGQLIFDFNRTHEYRRGGDQLDRPPHEAFIAEEIISDRTSGSIGWRHAPSADFDYVATASFSDMRRDSYYGTFMDPNAYGDTHSLLYVLDSQFNHYVGRRHVLSWGGQLSSETLQDSQPSYGRFIDEHYTNAGAFVQWDYAFANGWQLLAGSRIDKHSTIDTLIASPRLALMYAPIEDLTVRASVSTGFRPPQAFDEDLHLSAAGGVPQLIFLSPDLREERSRSLMLGAEWKPQLGAGQALVEINGFYTRLVDLFHNVEADDPNTDAFEFLKINFGGAGVYGVEANVGWGIGDDLVLQGGMVVQRARFDEPEPDWGSQSFFRTPNVYGNFSATWNNRIADLFVGTRYTGAMDVPHYAGYIDENTLERTAPYVTVDVSVSRSFLVSSRVLALRLAIRNLTDEFQPDLDRGPLRDASYVYGPRFPRTIQIGARVDF